MAELFDREPEDILRDARAHMNPTVYDRGRVSQKLAATRRAWDGQSAVNGGALPDPFAPGAKLAAALKLSSWKVIMGGVAGLMLASGAYVAFPSSPSPSGRTQPAAAETQAEVAPQNDASGERAGEAAELPAQANDASSERARFAQDGPSELERTRARRAPSKGNMLARSEGPRKRVTKAERARAAQPAATQTSAARAGQRLTSEAVEDTNEAALANEAPVEAEPAEPAAPAQSSPPPAAPEPAAAAKPPLDPLIEDLSLLKRAAAVLHRGDPQSAQSLLREHARRFPQSEARLERHALAFAAACAIGDTKSAEQHRATLLREAPNSALSARVRAGCGMSER